MSNTKIRNLKDKISLCEYVCNFITKNSQFSFLILNHDYKILYVQVRADLRAIGLDKNELVGKNLKWKIKTEDFDKFKSYLRKKPEEKQLFIRFKTKKGFIPLLSKTEIYLNKNEFQKKRIIMTLKRMENEIFEEYPPEDIQQIFKQAYEQAVLYRSLFSHDINNILNNIKTAASLCMMDLEDRGDIKNIKEYCALVIEQVARGVKLVQNVHNLSLIEKKGIVLESTDLCKTLKDAKSYIEHSYQTRTIEINFNNIQKTKYQVIANPLLLDVFENIFINSVKYNEKPVVRIWIQIREDLKNGEKFIRVEISDNSIGIEDKKKRELFWHKSASLKRREGLGIGLSLIKKIINRYGGKIWVENRIKSDYSQGSKFVVLLKKA